MSTPLPSNPTPQCLKRLTGELQTLRTSPSPLSPAIATLSPLADSDLLQWGAILLGPPSTPYSQGRWLLSLHIPTNYPLSPPQARFITPCCHPNISFKTGEICLDLLKKDGWAATYTLVKVLEAVRDMLRWPDPDSPLNVDAAGLVREDKVAWEGVCRFWCEERRWEGAGLEMEKHIENEVVEGEKSKGGVWSWW